MSSRTAPEEEVTVRATTSNFDDDDGRGGDDSAGGQGGAAGAMRGTESAVKRTATRSATTITCAEGMATSAMTPLKKEKKRRAEEQREGRSEIRRAKGASPIIQIICKITNGSSGASLVDRTI